jgi:hypothetical protein
MLCISIACPVAGEPASPVAVPSPCEEPAIYQNAQNPFLMKLRLRGRYHGQAFATRASGSESQELSGWEERRIRLGFEATLWSEQISLRMEAVGADSFASYEGLNDASLAWRPHENFSISVGKQKPQFAAYDRLQSSNSHPVIERSHIYEQVRTDTTMGVVVEGEHNTLTWQSGIYSNAAAAEFGSLGGGYSVGGGIGGKPRKDLTWRLDALLNHSQPGDTALRGSRQLLSTTVQWDNSLFRLATEAIIAHRDGDSIAGFYLLPSYAMLEGRLQLVGRYSFSCGSTPESLEGLNRYANKALPTIVNGGQHHGFYLGVQYFLKGDCLKWMGGVEYACLRGGTRSHEATTFLTSLRFSF